MAANKRNKNDPSFIETEENVFGELHARPILTLDQYN